VGLAEEEMGGSSASDARRPRRGRRGLDECDGDEALLPPAVLKSRRKDPGHWANGWLPPSERPKAVSPLHPGAPRGGDDNLWAQAEMRRVRHSCSKTRACVERQLARVEHMEGIVVEAPPEAEEDEELNSEDDPPELELLSREETDRKRDVWHEVNKDLLHFFHVREQRHLEGLRQTLQRRRGQARDAQHPSVPLAARVQSDRLRSEQRAQEVAAGYTAAAARSVEQGPSKEEVRFWEEHRNSRLWSSGRGDNGTAAELEENIERQQARVAVAAALKEEQEQQEQRRHAKRMRFDFDALFDDSQPAPASSSSSHLVASGASWGASADDAEEEQRGREAARAAVEEVLREERAQEEKVRKARKLNNDLDSLFD